MTPLEWYMPKERVSCSHHRQVLVSRDQISVAGESVLVDARIAPLITELWRADADTYMSCERHAATGKIWIGFESAEDAERFLDVVLDDATRPRWGRREQWYFGENEKVSGPLGRGGQAAHPAGWEFHASVYDESIGREVVGRLFSVKINVLFPSRDLAEVTKRLQAFNVEMARELDAPVGGDSVAVESLGASV